jgi:hypothetical protein
MKKNNKSIKIISKSRKIKGTKKQRVQKHKKTQKRVFKLRGGNVEEVKKKYIGRIKQLNTYYENNIKKRQYKYEISKDISDNYKIIGEIETFKKFLIEVKNFIMKPSVCESSFLEELKKDPEMLASINLLGLMFTEIKSLEELINSRINLIESMNELYSKFYSRNMTENIEKYKKKIELDMEFIRINTFLDNLKADAEFYKYLKGTKRQQLVSIIQFKKIIEEKIKLFKIKSEIEEAEAFVEEFRKDIEDCEKNTNDFAKSLTDHSIDEGPSKAELERLLAQELAQ